MGKHFDIESVDGVTVVGLKDPKLFDTMIVAELQDELIEYIDENTPERMIVDFSKVTHCSTAVINGLLRAKKRVTAGGGEIKFSDMHDTIRDAYRMLNLDGTVFDIHDTRGDAVRAF